MSKWEIFLCNNQQLKYVAAVVKKKPVELSLDSESMLDKEKRWLPLCCDLASDAAVSGYLKLLTLHWLPVKVTLQGPVVRITL